MCFLDKKRKEEPKAKVKYYVKASVGGLHYKQVLIVREQPVELK